ncbi:MAG: MmgE/PrpD family protein [Candidatus Rokubacteria bacterium]|nr:MmgE/PrpD family protein [Candidatus Rokubacteria bacterium]
MMDITRPERSADVCFAKFAVAQSFDSLPRSVVERTKAIFLDTLGIMARGACAPSVSSLRKTLVHGGSGSSTVLGTPCKAHPSVAALLNASLPTITQYDEGHRRSLGHPGIHIVPAAFAVGEDKRISGKDIIIAISTGYEVSARIGLSVFPMNPLVHPHGHWPTIGAAVAVGKILSFTERQFVDLINSMSTLTLFTWRKNTIAGATIHHLAPGLGASHAIIVALAIQGGLIGPPRCLEEYFLPFSSSQPKPEILTEGLGNTYEILNNYFKAYPACAHAHSSIEALENILATHSMSAEEVDRIEVRTYPLASRLNERNPPNALAGMFSIPYCLGTILVRGKLTVDGLATEAPMDPDILNAASRIRVVVDGELNPRYPEGRPSLVRVHLKNGATYEHLVDLPRREKIDSIPGRELEEKFLQMVEPLIGKGRGEELKRRIQDLESVADITELSVYLS